MILRQEVWKKYPRDFHQSFFDVPHKLEVGNVFREQWEKIRTASKLQKFASELCNERRRHYTSSYNQRFFLILAWNKKSQSR